MIIHWNDFINEVLLKGQVQEIIIYPNYVGATIKRGATYKGKYIFRHLQLYNVPDMKNVEEKIRALEKRIGIRMGITRIYFTTLILNII